LANLLGSGEPRDVWQGEQLRIAVDALAMDPRPKDGELLEESTDPDAYELWRVTVYRYRVLYRVTTQTVTVLDFTTGLG
jgi:hypothetical protein